MWKIPLAFCLFNFLTPTHLFSGQPPEVDFLNQKLENFCAVGPAITRARAPSTSRASAGRAGRPRWSGRAGRRRSAAGCCAGQRAGDQAGRRGAVCCSSGGRRSHRGGAELKQVQPVSSSANHPAGRKRGRHRGRAAWQSRKKKKTGRAGRCGLLCLLCCLPLFSLLSGGGVAHLCRAGGAVLLHRFTLHRMPPGYFSRGGGAVLLPCQEGDILST